MSEEYENESEAFLERDDKGIYAVEPGERIILDDKGEEVSREDITRGLTLDEGYKEAQRRKTARQRDAREADEAKAQAEADEVRRSERESTNLSQTDRQAIASHVERQRQYQADVAQLSQALAQAQANPASVTTADRQVLAHAEDRLKAEGAAIDEANAFVRKNLQERRAAANRHGMLAGLPELRDEGVRNDFVKWAAKRHGVSEARVRSETNADIVGKEFRAFEAEKEAARKAHINRPRTPLYQGGALSVAGAMPKEMTPADAMSRLRRTGNMSDAMNALVLMREREAENA